MDLIYTNSMRIDQGVLSAYSLDLSFGATENDFELILGKCEPVLDDGACVYIEGTEYGGKVDGTKSNTKGETITYTGRTWHGILNSKIIQPDDGKDYFTVSGDLHDVLRLLVSRLGLSDLFSVVEEVCGINISNYKFARYCKGYDGLRAMLASVDMKLKIAWIDNFVCLSAKPINNNTGDPIDGDVATLSVERYSAKVNHLICLGRGELSEREVIHLYADKKGKIGNTQYYFGIDEYTEIYENANAESYEELRNEGIERFKELRDIDKSDISLSDIVNSVYDIGDIVSAMDRVSGLSAKSNVTQKIVRINNGIIDVEHKVGS